MVLKYVLLWQILCVKYRVLLSIFRFCFFPFFCKSVFIENTLILNQKYICIFISLFWCMKIMFDRCLINRSWSTCFLEEFSLNTPTFIILIESQITNANKTHHLNTQKIKVWGSHLYIYVVTRRRMFSLFQLRLFSAGIAGVKSIK